MIILKVILIFIIAVMLFIYVNPVFGDRASKQDKEDYKRRSENYVKGKFIYPSRYVLQGETFDNRVSNKGKLPKINLPLVKPSINKINIDEFTVTWLGHSSLLIQMHDIHMLPEESVKAANILGAKITMPIHWGTFILSNHGWDDPVERFLKASSQMNNKVITPKIGETVYLNKYMDYQKKWWRYYQ